MNASMKVAAVFEQLFFKSSNKNTARVGGVLGGLLLSFFLFCFFRLRALFLQGEAEAVFGWFN